MNTAEVRVCTPLTRRTRTNPGKTDFRTQDSIRSVRETLRQSVDISEYNVLLATYIARGGVLPFSSPYHHHSRHLFHLFVASAFIITQPYWRCAASNVNHAIRTPYNYVVIYDEIFLPRASISILLIGNSVFSFKKALQLEWKRDKEKRNWNIVSTLISIYVILERVIGVEKSSNVEFIFVCD